MPRKNRNNGHNHRGRGGRGRGRGAYRGSNARGRGNEIYPPAGHELDYDAQRYPLEGYGFPDSRRSYESTPRSGGKTPQWVTDNPLRENGYGTPRGRGQHFGFGNGRGRGGGQYQARGWPRGMPQRGRGPGTRRPSNLNAPLSDLLYLERPLLKPIKFVRATHTPFLFQESEEIFQTPSTSNIQSNVPTAERVACIFNNTQPSLPAETISEGETSDELEEIDFADLGTLRARVDAAEHTAQRKMKPDLRDAVVKGTFKGVYNKEQPRHVRERGPERRPGEENSVTVAADDTTLRILERPIETLRTKNNHDVRAFPGERSTWNPSESAKATLPRPNNTLADYLTTLNTGAMSRRPTLATTGRSQHPFEETAATAGTGHIGSNPDAVECTAQRKTREESTTVTMDGTFTRDTLELSGAKETEQNTTEEEFSAVATGSTTLRTLEQSIETLQVRENHHVGTFFSERSPQNSSESEVELALPKPKNSRADSELEDNPCSGNTAGELLDDFSSTLVPLNHSRAPPQATPVPPCGTRRGEILGEEEEIIVYLPSCSLLTGTPETWSASKEPKASITGRSPTLSNPQPLSLDAISLDFQRAEPSTHPRFPPAFTPSQKRKGKLRSKAKDRDARTQFRAFGAMLSESRLRDADENERRDKKWETRRKDDSDIDWGDGHDNAEKSDMRTGTEALVVGDADEPSISEGGMELDPDVDLDVNAMLAFVQSMSEEGSRFVTIDDIEDKRRMIEEDQDRDDSGSCDGSEEDQEEAAVLQLEEQLMIAESDGKDFELDSDDEDALLGEEARALKGSKNNRGAMHSGASVDLSPIKRMSYNEVSKILMMITPPGRMKAKDKADYLPEDLRAQWERDRAKKAENKRLRKQAMMLASLDPSVPKKGGKKARKLMVAALKEMEHVGNELNDISSIEANIRRFIANIDGRRSMPLLPMMKSTRKIVHELATAFNLKSDSKGHGPGRYITLVKTNRTGTINEGKVKAIMKRATRGSGRYVPSHREGDEVGKEAPAIGSSNVGFKMLASMGWSEGAKIGGDTSVGIEVPLTAVIKKSRLGLGATRT
ncbi:hypothetical protein BKA83DRAFT_4284209 [Pisolithus microcarpus]|nr:hypothetical protein BKA83DRAFT_4284209 [Pisolithus microcarpus]